jgi:hypothetical protein
MLIQVYGDYFQHDQVSLVKDIETDETDVLVSGRVAFTTKAEDYLEKLVQRIREAEKQEADEELTRMSRAFRGFIS